MRIPAAPLRAVDSGLLYAPGIYTDSFNLGHSAHVQYHPQPGVVMSETETTATEPEVTEQSADIGEQAAAAVKGDDPTTSAEAEEVEA